MAEHSATCLGDYVDLQRGNTYKSPLLGQPGPVLLGLASIARNGGFKSDNLKTYGGHSDPRILLRPGDIYVSLKDVTQSADLLGAVSRVPNEIKQGRLTQDTVKLVFRPNAPRDYIYWCLRSPQYREFCRAHATGTTNLGLPRDDFLSFPIPAPTASRVSLIALLQALESKVDLNRRMNETLEASARMIFKDWFVDFGPTRTKTAGRAPYLAPEIWSLFPSLLDNEGKPQGWENGVLGDFVLNFDSRRVPVSGSERAKRQGCYPYHGATSVMDYVDNFLFDGIYLLIGEDGSVIKEESGTAFTQYVWGKIWVNNHAHVLQGRGPVSTEQLFLYFQHEPVAPYITGAVQLKLSQGRMNSMPFIFAGESVCKEFGKQVAPFFERIRCNGDEAKTLAAIRDLLLSKLMSGESRVTDAEKIAEAAL